MRVLFFGKVALFAALGAGASMATWVIVANTTQTHAAQQEDPTAILRPAGDGELPIPEVPAGGIGLGSSSMNLDKAEAIGGLLHVSGASDVYDTRPNNGFIWRLRILDSADPTKVRFERFYPDKIFTLGDDLKQSVEFDDIFQSPVGPGSYVVELLWFRIDPDLGMAMVENPELCFAQQGPPGCKRLVIE
jgi:hypothetical protein